MAIVYPERSLRYSYEAFFRGQRNRERSYGIRCSKGDHIAIMAPNVPEWLILQSRLRFY
ncbi:hypothetical protein ACEQPO_15585 [Bacillus sp. SL00103]